MKNKLLILSLVSFYLVGCKQSSTQENWIQLFNGKDLTGWTVKIAGYPAGENFGNTFYVEDGLLKVKYDAYGDDFAKRFGHLFTKNYYTHYKLRVEYRFVGEQAKGGPQWAYRNSGAMLHSQNPETMALDQDFPVSIEAQMLGGDGTNERRTGNVCTPGTGVSIDGKPYDGHCYNSKSKTYHGDQWVTLEMVVLGDSIVHHIMEGDTILTYTRPTVDEENVSSTYSSGTALGKGHIALQSESHPIEFRKVELLDLTQKKGKK
ncbi:MAG: DUF1080 domain-containing protein [Prevotellaceae bacterium]|jgi:hypothetical protein|nr:DUF1080 domain-containing protein [Prevotellaceae bacterium]